MPKSIDLPLHGGSCPPWLFKRMRKLGKLISIAIIEEYKTKGFLQRMSNPIFFQALGSFLGFDWHSSGLTTTVLGALKSADLSDYGIFIAGGKGKTSRKTPDQISKFSDSAGIDPTDLITASRMTAKVDTLLIQDGYNLYHHNFIFDDKKNWVVIQQGMNNNNGYARRYHWNKTELGDTLIKNPNESLIGFKENVVLNLTGKQSEESRKAMLDILSEDVNRLKRSISPLYYFPKRHYILPTDLTKKDWELISIAHEIQPRSFYELVHLKGFGQKKIRALVLLSKILYGTEPDWKDPVKYSFAHGGKDGFPYPVDKELYDNTISFLNEIVR